MAAVSNGRIACGAMDSPTSGSIQETTQNGGVVVDRLKILYPIVNEEDTPLPRAWSAKDKYNYIGLSQNNLRVHYKGHGKTHKDAASVRATHPIPPACGLYYFEVKIISKGRDGYMGVGLSAQGVNMNRLPGWDKNSYGYHGDDGHSFCSSGTGQPYGPTFTTGDVIGCGVNLIDNTCFYTKNGHHLGIAFTDLPPNLYPTVGLQTPGEVVDANFGQQPFVFDIEDMMRELRARTRLSILEYPVPESQGEWQAILHKMVSTYLVHHGYCATAEAFAQSTGQAFNEEVTSIKNRQRILKLILSGRMGEAIELTSRLYPGLLEHNQNLLFMLKCRQFVEMVNGSDSEVCPPRCPRGLASYQSTSLLFNNNTTGGTSNTNTNTSSSSCSGSQRPNSPIQTSVIQSTKTYSNNTNTTNTNNSNNHNNSSNKNNKNININNNNNNNGTTTTSLTLDQQQQQSTLLNQHQHHQNNTLNGNSTSVTTSESVTTSTSSSSVTPAVAVASQTNSPPPIVSKSPSTNSVGVSGEHQQHQVHQEDSDIEMETTSSDDTQNGHSTTPINSSSSNGKVSPVNVGGGDHQVVNNTTTSPQSQSQSPPSATNGYQNGNSHKSANNIIYDEDEDMDVDLPLSRRQLCGGSKPAVERMLEFGRELYNMSQRLRQEQGKCERNKKMLRDAFSLLAYSNPWASPVGWQLDPMQRETVCASLNSAILESSDLPRRPPLEVTIAHAQELVRLMSGSGLGSCAFASVDDILQH